MNSFDRIALAKRIVTELAPYISVARRARIREVLDARTRAVTVVLEDVANEHNGAAVFRTAEALGLMEVHLIPNKSRFKISRKVARGTQKWLETTRYSSTQACYASLRERGFDIWVSALHGDACPVQQIPCDRPVALVFGNEHRGVSDIAFDQAHGRFYVPMHGFVESLNISVAVALALSAVVNPRREAGKLAPLDIHDRALVEAAWYMRSVRAAHNLLARSGVYVPVVPEQPYIEVPE